MPDYNIKVKESPAVEGFSSSGHKTELRLINRDLTSTLPNQIDFVVLFGGS